MMPLSMLCGLWTVLSRTEVVDRGDVGSAYVQAGVALISAYPQPATSQRDEDGLFADRRCAAFVSGRSDIDVGDRLEDGDGRTWQVTSSQPTAGGCTLTIARLP